MPIQLGPLQFAVLRSLWSRHSASVNEVHRDLQRTLKVAPTTVATVLRRMEAKGLVRHTESGRTYYYQPIIALDNVAESAAEDVLDRLFAGQLKLMVTHLLDSRPVSGSELDELAQLIARKRQQKKKKLSGG